VTANCPSCGGPIEFAIGSSEVVVCGYCNSVVARTDRGLESHGKVAALIDTGSPIRKGATGRYAGQGFRITGRTQLRHQAGGIWDEWYAAFDDGRWGWLAEAQGRFYITFTATTAAPPLAQLGLGNRVPGLDGFVVAEIGEAVVASAEGELPWTPEPGGSYMYADLTGAGRRFATIDYSEAPPVVFQGTEATLPELGIEGGESPARGAGRAAVTVLNCSQCGGALQLRAPESERVWCPNCGAAHDITQGKLQYLTKLKKKRIDLAIPLGGNGTVADGGGKGDSYVVAGVMERAVTFDRTYYWLEYLLYNRDKGFRWLVQSDDHWSFVTPLRPGEVLDSSTGRNVAKAIFYSGQIYKLFQTATARVTYVLGEFYWKVEMGELVDTADYIAPPFGISKEITTTGAQELSYSHARYMTPDEVEQAFGVKKLRRPQAVGPMQPFNGPRLGYAWAAMVVALLAIAIALGVTRPNRVALQQIYDVEAAPPAEGAPPNGRVLFSEPFDLSGNYNVEIDGMANLENSWIYVDGDLVNEAGGVVRPFELPLEYYHGYDDGESWSEGSRSHERFLSRPEKGRYVLRMETQWENGKTPPPLHVTVREGVFRWIYFIVALLLISLPPLGTALMRIGFESQRWKDSSFTPFGMERSELEDED